MAPANSWMFPKITDYLDSRNDALLKYANVLENSANPDAASAEIRDSIQTHIQVLPPKMFLTVAFVIADDLYKVGNRLTEWNESHRRYVEATAGAFYAQLRKAGYALRYFIDNLYEHSEVGLQRPLLL